MKQALALLLGLSGCASGSLLPAGDLLTAQRTLAQAAESPFASEATSEIGAAESALTQAEREHETHPGSVRAADAAYVALRAAEKAMVTSRVAAERIALEKARGAALRLQADLERRDAFFASLARRRAAQAQAEIDLREAHRAALARASGPSTQIVERPAAFVFRVPVEEMFLPGTSLLRDGAAAQLASLCRCLVAPYTVQIVVADDLDGVHTSAATLAARRRLRVHQIMRGYGVPESAFLPPERWPLPGTQVDVIVGEPAIPLPADE
ncbi:Hypothetical protein A7982_05982 [Minicystis rosea]|nr:Hypothetical protein A7982_05982 [Minicystis rosea]